MWPLGCVNPPPWPEEARTQEHATQSSPLSTVHLKQFSPFQTLGTLWKNYSEPNYPLSCCKYSPQVKTFDFSLQFVWTPGHTLYHTIAKIYIELNLNLNSWADWISVTLHLERRGKYLEWDSSRLMLSRDVVVNCRTVLRAKRNNL